MYLVIGIIVLLVIIAAFYFLSKGKGGQSSNLETDAKRFARLLVSEIKLYDESKVERGRQNKNLADSLGGEIAEARKKYRKRVTGENEQTYFDAALVEILADGDAGKLDSGIKSSLK